RRRDRGPRRGGDPRVDGRLPRRTRRAARRGARGAAVRKIRRGLPRRVPRGLPGAQSRPRRRKNGEARAGRRPRDDALPPACAGFSRIALRARLTAREITVLRAIAKYLRQAGSTFSQDYMEDALAAHPSIAGRLVELFQLRLNPARFLDTDAKARALDRELE